MDLWNGLECSLFYYSSIPAVLSGFAAAADAALPVVLASAAATLKTAVVAGIRKVADHPAADAKPASAVAQVRVVVVAVAAALVAPMLCRRSRFQF